MITVEPDTVLDDDGTVQEFVRLFDHNGRTMLASLSVDEANELIRDIQTAIRKLSAEWSH